MLENNAGLHFDGPAPTEPQTDTVSVLNEKPCDVFDSWESADGERDLVFLLTHLRPASRRNTLFETWFSEETASSHPRSRRITPESSRRDVLSYEIQPRNHRIRTGITFDCQSVNPCASILMIHRPCDTFRRE